MNEIVKETFLSKGTVNNIVQDWKARINGTEMEEIRGFIAEVRKSGMSLQECAQAFRIANTLRKLNVYDEFDERIVNGDYDGENETGSLIQAEQKNIMEEGKAETEEEDEEEDEDNHLGFKRRDVIGLIRSAITTHQTSSTANYTKTNNPEESKIFGAKGYQINYFITTIYKNCKNNGIKPSIIIEWISDLFNFYSVSPESSEDKQIDNHHLHNQNQNHYQNPYMKDTNENTPTEIQSDKIEDEIPLVSKVSFLIQQKNKEIRQLADTKSTIIQEISRLNEQKEKIRGNLSSLIEQEKKAISYIQWYNNLKQELRNKFNLAIEVEFGSFARAINDLKNYDYNMPQIILEYKDLLSIREQRESLKREIDLNNRNKKHLLEDLFDLRDQVDARRLAIKTSFELQGMGFAFKKLKQLRDLILEISSTNNIDSYQAITKFFKDIERDYDTKLGFELKIKEMQGELEQLDNKVRENQRFLAMQDPSAPNVAFLHFQGLTNDDITGITFLIQSLNNSYSLDYKSIKKNILYINTNSNNNNIIEKKEFWKLVVNKFKDLSSINSEIERAKSHLQELQDKTNGHTRTQF